jgi:hypothetical protein
MAFAMAVCRRRALHRRHEPPIVLAEPLLPDLTVP